VTGIKNDSTIPNILLETPPENGVIDTNNIYIKEKKLTFSFKNAFTLDNNESSTSSAQIDSFIASRPDFVKNDMRTLKDMFNYLYKVGNGEAMQYQQGGMSIYNYFFGKKPDLVCADGSKPIEANTPVIEKKYRGNWKSDMEKIFVFSFKRMVYDSIQDMHRSVTDKALLLDFYHQFVWCNLMTPHYTCNNIANLIIGFASGAQTPHCFISSIISLMLKMTINPPLFPPVDVTTGKSIPVPVETPPPPVDALPTEPNEIPLDPI